MTTAYKGTTETMTGDIDAMTQAASVLKVRDADGPAFHTPPPVHESRSWLAEKSEQESYGVPNEDHSSLEAKPLADVAPTSEVGGISAVSAISAHSSSSSLHREVIEEEPEHSATGPPPLPSRRSVSQTSQEPNPNDPESLPPLPRKLLSLVESFVHSLQEPKYATPLTGDQISQLYQDFYAYFALRTADYVVGTVNRPPKEVPLETYHEIAEKKKERSRRPNRIRLLCEAGEASACEAVYNKIFNISFGEEGNRNSYIQAKVKALKAIPVTLEHLELSVPDGEFLPLIQDAGTELRQMDAARIPRLKLHHLLRAHKVIVKALTEKKGDQTSADAILPALLFSFIHFETPNLWLNVNFIQRFRNRSSLQGEDMYCLTNFEAAVAFLESLTLDSLNIDVTSVPADVDITPLLALRDADPLKSNRSSRSNSLQQQQPPAGSHQRQNSTSNINLAKRLSVLYPTDLATNAVNSADQSIRSLGSSLGSSYRFLVGRFVDKKDGDGDNKYPDTLAEARQVVGLDPFPDSDNSLHVSRKSSQEHLPSALRSRDTTPSGIGRSPLKNRSRSSSLQAGNNSDTSVFGKLAGGVMRNFRSPSFGNSEEVLDQTDPKSGKIAKPIERLLSCETDALKMSDIRELHADYKRLAKLLRSVNAFD